MELGLKGKAALVTGASEGIGMAIARKLAEEGVRVAICARTEAKLKETAAEIAQATGMQIVPIAADLRTLAGCQGFVAQAAERLGGIDILVNNAGASAFGAFVDLPDDAFVDAINGKLLGYIRCAKAAIPVMRRTGGGRIVNFADWLARSGRPAYHGFTSYYVAKAGIIALTEALALELAGDQILVNAIAPGPILAPPDMDPAEVEAVAKATPVGRWGGEIEIAKAVTALIETDFITGETVRVDGGRHIV